MPGTATWPCRTARGYLRAWRTAGAVSVQVSEGVKGAVLSCDGADLASLPLPARPALLCSWATCLSGNLCSARVPPLLGSPP